MLCSLTLAGIVKTHQLGYQECVPLQAMFNKDLSPNHIAGPARYRGHIAMGDLSLELPPLIDILNFDGWIDRQR